MDKEPKLLQGKQNYGELGVEKAGDLNDRSGFKL
jgi:hypothetical protein